MEEFRQAPVVHSPPECLKAEVEDMIKLYANAVDDLTLMDEMMPETHASLPMALLERGFDVWLDGNRGTMYQRGHTEEDIYEEDYWDFSFADMA